MVRLDLTVKCTSWWAPYVVLVSCYGLFFGLLFSGVSANSQSLFPLLIFNLLIWPTFAYPTKLQLLGDRLRVRTFIPKEMSVQGLTVRFDSVQRRLEFLDQKGKRKSIGSSWWPVLTGPELTRFLQALHEAGAEVTGHPLPVHQASPREFTMTTRLTTALNWRWPDCSAASADFAAARSAQTQTVTFSPAGIGIVRDGVAVLADSLAGAVGLKWVKQDEARLALKTSDGGVWPLADWNAPELSAFEAALIERGVAVREETWVAPMREVQPTW